MKVIEFDVVFLSYDEPNADLHYADLCNKIPWSKRVHGIKGSDEAHKEAARCSETDWVITVDADNIVDPKFFSLDIETEDPTILVYSWLGRNVINGLQYGNGGLKIWRKDFILNMRTHEASDSDRAQVDFCWEDGYRQFKTCFSDVHVNGSAFQAWRAGFREGVKMTLDNGIKVNPSEIEQRIWWHNLHRLKMWATVGSHVDHGLFAILGTRMGTYMTNCTDWNYVDVRDFEILRELYDQEVKKYEEDPSGIVDHIKNLGDLINTKLGIKWPYLDATQSKYTVDLYNETLNLNTTYYRTPDGV
jgi:hypothetical protein